jgi:hypothetical protein
VITTIQVRLLQQHSREGTPARLRPFGTPAGEPDNIGQKSLNHDSLDSQDYLDYLNHGNPMIPKITVQTWGETRKPVHTNEPAFDLTIRQEISLQ